MLEAHHATTASPAMTPSAPLLSSRRFSERALDATAFCLADAAAGLGPFLVIDLTSRRHWSAGEAGFTMSMMLLGTVLSQPLIGAWIDRTPRKRLAIGLAAVFVALASVALYYIQDRLAIYVVQLAVGVAVAIFPPALAAISLGLVGRDRLPARAGRNEACFHAGNVVAAGLAIVASRFVGNLGVFWGVALLALASAACVAFIAESDIDHQMARGADGPPEDARIVSCFEILRDPRLIRFTVTVVLFHFANAAMLPLVGQKLGRQHPQQASELMGICIVVAQLVMVPVAIIASRWARSARRPIFLVGFAVLPIRGFLYTLTDNSFWLIANQILDGIGAAIFGVLALLVMADLTRNTGRFNFAQGVVATAIGLGSAFSNTVTGLIVDRAGYNAGFVFLAAIACVASGLFAATVPETLKPDVTPQPATSVA